ncbi:hypothetical protein [Phycicoccus avicenniae]|uniref:hypothetical protein n=1 Tax=Phycicoccus avicenniae TaxID=2828860 RepID=UPI003D26A61A
MTDERDGSEVLDIAWRERHRRMWRFLVLAPYPIFGVFVLLIPLRESLRREAVVGIAVLGLVALAAYVVVGLGWVWQVYRDAHRRMRR